MADTRKNYFTAEREVLSGKVAPAYLLGGSRFSGEPYMRDRFIDLLRKKYFREDTADMNYLSYHAGVDKGEEILASLISAPLFGGERMIVLHDVENLPFGSLKSVTAYLSAPADDLCFVMTSLKFDARRKWHNLVAPNSICVRVESPFPSQVPEWIVRLSKDRGKNISSGAVRLLHSYTGDSLSTLDMELEKLSLFVGEKEEIDEDDVKGAIGFSKELSQFDLEKFLARKDISSSLLTMESMMGRGEESYRITVGIFNFLFNTMKAKEIGGKKSGKGTMRMRTFEDAAKRWSREELRRGIIRVRDADLAIKSRKTPHKMILTKLAVDLLSEAETR